METYGGVHVYRSKYSWPRHYLEVSGQLHDPSALPPVHIGYYAGWGPEPAWTMRKGEKSYLYRDSNSDPLAVHAVASRYTDCTILASSRMEIKNWIMYYDVTDVTIK
jgi:hypothetical protein